MNSIVFCRKKIKWDGQGLWRAKDDGPNGIFLKGLNSSEKRMKELLRTTRLNNDRAHCTLSLLKNWTMWNFVCMYHLHVPSLTSTCTYVIALDFLIHCICKTKWLNTCNFYLQKDQKTKHTKMWSKCYQEKTLEFICPSTPTYPKRLNIGRWNNDVATTLHILPPENGYL